MVATMGATTTAGISPTTRSRSLVQETGSTGTIATTTDDQMSATEATEVAGTGEEDIDSNRQAFLNV